LSVTRLVALALTGVCALAFGVSPVAVASTTPAPQPYNISGGGSFAYGNGFDPITGLNADVQVQVGLTTFRPNRLGGKSQTIQTSLVDANFFMSTGGTFAQGFGCWIIPTDDYVINSDLSATLNFDSSDPRVSECPGDPVGPNGLASSGLVIGLTGPIHINVSWTATSPITSIRTSQRESCQPFFNTSEGSQQNVDAVAHYVTSGAFDITPGEFSGDFQTDFGSVGIFSGQGEIKGFPGACGPF
jgi:hypothetical protein